MYEEMACIGQRSSKDWCMIRMSGKAEFLVLARGSCISMHGGVASEWMVMFLIYKVL